MVYNLTTVASREDLVAQMAALRTSAGMSGLTEVVARWSAAEPAVGSFAFEEPDFVCEVVMSPELTVDSMDRS